MKNPFTNQENLASGNSDGGEEDQAEFRFLEDLEIVRQPILLYGKLNRFLMAVNIFSFLLIILLIVEHISLYPLVLKRTKWVQFLTRENAVVQINPVDEFVGPELVQAFLEAYVISRESFGATKVETGSIEVVYDKNNPESWTMDLDWYYYSRDDLVEEFKKHVLPRRMELGARVERSVRVLRYQRVSNSVSQFELHTEDELDGKPWRDDYWLVSLSYEFQKEQLPFGLMGKNPIGMKITRYSIKKTKGTEKL